jgi:hypothetical protein
MRHPSIRPIKSPGRTITKRTPERIGQTTLISRKSSTKKMRLICRGRIGLRPRADFTPEGQHRGAFLLSGHPLVLRHKHMIHIIGMAGLVPASKSLPRAAAPVADAGMPGSSPGMRSWVAPCTI